jgi:hypothetical protein
MTIKTLNKWVFKVDQSIFIKCYVCEQDFDIVAVCQEDGFCPSCNNIEIDLSDDPYQERLAELEKAE